MAILSKTVSVRVSSVQIIQVRVQNKGKSVWKTRYDGDVSSSNDTYVSVPLLSLGSSTVRSNPLPGTSSHCKINRSSWPNKTQICEKKYEAISNHAYKRSKKTQITFMDKKIDLIINSKFIRSQ